jgi:predicted LPLAT superfamily acyltransferase
MVDGISGNLTTSVCLSEFLTRKAATEQLIMRATQWRYRSNGMSDAPNTPGSATRMSDEEALEFAEQVFDRARAGDATMLDRLLENGLTPNLRNHKGDTLLMLASYHGHQDAVRVLLKHGADPEIRNDNGQSPIAGAAFKGDLDVVRILVDGGAEVEGASADGRTALMMAAMFNRTAIVDYLISKGANPHVQDAKGVTPLMAAQTMGATETAEQLTRLSI